MIQPIIELTHVTKKYGLHEGLSDVSLTLERGGLVGLVGPNGSGKSTFLKLLAGLLHPNSGELKVGGTTIIGRNNPRVSFLSEVDSLYPFYTVEETIRFAFHVFPDFNQEKAREMISFLNLEYGKKVQQLSKGNRARLKIILSLARKVPLILMDEPLSGLDPMAREDILKLLARYAEIEAQTIIVSTHEVTEIEPLLDHVILLKYGKLLLSSSVEQLREKTGKSVLETMKEAMA